MARSKAGSLPSYRLHKATGKAVVTVAGQDIYLGRYDTKESKAEYARVIVEFVVTSSVPNPHDHTGQEPVTVVEILAAYWKFAQGYYFKNSKPTDEQKAVKKVIRDTKALCGGLPATEVGPKVLKAIRQTWIDQGLCRRYINQNTGRIRRILSPSYRTSVYVDQGANQAPVILLDSHYVNKRAFVHVVAFAVT